MDELSRRRYVTMLVGGSAVALAGCEEAGDNFGPGTGTDTPTETDAPTPTDAGGGGVTASPTDATETPTDATETPTPTEAGTETPTDTPTGTPSEPDPSSLPWYADWLTPIDRATESLEAEVSENSTVSVSVPDAVDVVYSYADLSFWTAEEDNFTSQYPNAYQDESTLLLDLSLQSPLTIQFSSTYVQNTGMHGLLSSDEGAAIATSADEVFEDHTAFVFRGGMDVSEVTATLTSDAGGTDVFAQTSQHGGFDVYTTEADSRVSAVGVGDDVVIVPRVVVDDPVGAIEKKIDARNGDVTRAIDALGELDWIVAGAAGGHVISAAYGDAAGALQPDDSGSLNAGVFESGRGMAVSGTLLDDAGAKSVSSASSWRVGVSALGGEYTESEVAGAVGSTAAESSVTLDGVELDVTARWDDPDLVGYVTSLV